MSPRRLQSKNHFESVGERFTQPCETLTWPCERTDQGASCTNSPLLEMRTDHGTFSKYPSGLLRGMPTVAESITCSGFLLSTTWMPDVVGYLSRPVLTLKVLTGLPSSKTC